MRLRNLATFVLAFILVIAAVGDSFADISNAAVLFLRIAPGARAAGMGEAYVAVADDATATHWNPAGLGAHPLSGSWIDSRIPVEYRPLKAIASLKKGHGTGLDAWEIWALTEKGLIRYDNEWHSYEKFATKTTQTVKQIVSSYFNVEDEEKLAPILTRVAEANNKGSLESLTGLRDSILAVVPAEYSARESLSENLDSLIVCYPLCRLNWDQINEMEKLLGKGLSEDGLSEVETDRISFAVEKARMRFIPEDMKVPYNAYLTGDVTAIASTEEFLLIGTVDGLVAYNGKSWRSFGEDDGLPSTNVQCLYSAGKTIFVGTDKGVVRYAGLNVSDVPVSEQLPEGSVTAIGASGLSNIWIVLNSDLYHFNGAGWSNAVDYTVVLADTPDTIAEKFALYDTPEEKQDWLVKFSEMTATPVAPVIAAEIPATEEGEVAEADQDSSGVTEETAAPETAPADETADLPEAAPQPKAADGLTPGMILDVPYVAGINEEVLSIHVDILNRVWLGTENGIYVFDGKQWETHGRDRRINKIGGNGATLYFATDSGLVEFDGVGNWRRSSVKGMGDAYAVDVMMLDGEPLVASDEKVVLRASGRTVIDLMHVNWLPELADDLWYGFMSFVHDFSWGTTGVSLTGISYGTFQRTGEMGPEVLGDFESFDIALGLSYGTSLTNKLKGGVTAKIIYSRLADIGAGEERGTGSATGFAIDMGLLQQVNDRLRLGLAITNIGPKMTYIDAAQADDLPRNLAFGFAYELMKSDFYELLVTSEINKILVGLDDGFSAELEQTVFNTGAEFIYGNILALRAGYIHDEEGKIKTMTLGAGVSLADRLKFDFAYIPSNSSVALANTLRISLALLP